MCRALRSHRCGFLTHHTSPQRRSLLAASDWTGTSKNGNAKDCTPIECKNARPHKRHTIEFNKQSAAGRRRDWPTRINGIPGPPIDFCPRQIGLQRHDVGRMSLRRGWREIHDERSCVQVCHPDGPVWCGVSSALRLLRIAYSHAVTSLVLGFVGVLRWCFFLPGYWSATVRCHLRIHHI